MGVEGLYGESTTSPSTANQTPRSVLALVASIVRADYFRNLDREPMLTAIDRLPKDFFGYT